MQRGPGPDFETMYRECTANSMLSPIFHPCMAILFYFYHLIEWRQDRGKWVGFKDNVVASGLGRRKSFVGNGRAISLFFCMNGMRKEFSGPVGLHFWQWGLFIFYTGGLWVRALTIENVLTREWGLSHGSAGDGCKGTWGLSIKTKGNQE